MERIKTIESVAEKVLERRIDARESDDILYLCVCEYFHRGVSNMSFGDFFKNRNKMSCPTFETVSRARRKIFDRRPELKPLRVTSLRKEMEEVFIEYAIS